MFQTTTSQKDNSSIKSVNITITGSVVEKSKTYNKPWVTRKEFVLYRDATEKTYDILRYEKKGDSCKSAIKEFNIL
jgi:hypothetical protein